jgi:hypothetical protein
MNAREKELARICEAVGGEKWVSPDDRMLFVCLTGADPRDARKRTYEPFDEAVGGKIPVTYKDAAMALYKIAASELGKFHSQRLCLAIEVFLSTVMSKDELDVFKAKTPMKYPIKQYADILEELEDEGVV